MIKGQKLRITQKTSAIAVSLVLLMSWLGTPLLAEEKADPAAETAAAEPPKPPQDPERVLMQELALTVEAGEPQWLPVDGQDILALYRSDTSGKNLGAVLLLHSTGAHPDWPQIVGPLRRQFPDHGWHSLAVALPPPKKPTALRITKVAKSSDGDTAEPAVAQEAPAAKEEKPEATEPETPAAPPTPELPGAEERVKAGIDYLKQQGHSKIIIIGRGTGAYWGTQYALDQGGVSGLVMINIEEPRDTEKPLIDMIEKLTVPVLDLFYPTTGDLAKARISHARLNPQANYQQTPLMAPQDHWLPEDNRLLRLVRGWAKRHL